MSKRAILTTHEYLVSAPLPEATETYTVIAHGTVIDKTKELLAAKGFEIERELYQCNQNAQVAKGVYHLKYGDDPDMSMMFAWNNSYDKSMKFKCSVGGYVHVSLASIIGANMTSWSRKHTGTADDEAFEMIQSQIENAEMYFKQLVSDKEAMKQISVTDQVRAELLGRLYLVHELLTSEQLAMIRMEIKKPSFVYTGVKDSLWSLYNAIIYSLQKSHPRTWMDQQRMTHWFLCTHFDIKPSILVEAEQNSGHTQQHSADPKQLDLLDVIAEIEQEQAAKEEEDDLEQRAAKIMQPIVTEEVSTGKEFAESADIIITVERTEVESAEELNAEAIPSESPEVMQEEKPVEVMTDDNSWPCLRCGQMQGPTSIFHDGQLCSNCANEV